MKVKDLYDGKEIEAENATSIITDFSAMSFGFSRHPKAFPEVIYSKETMLRVDKPETAIAAGYIENYKFGIFAKPGVDLSDFHIVYEKFYNIVDEAENLTEGMKFGIFSPTFVLTEGKKYTFGVELETCSGRLPGYLQRKYNLKCERDGSIKSGEYVTGVLIGDKGFEHLQKICNELSKRCEVDKFCSVHVHIGGVIFNKEFIVYTYILAKLIEKEIFNMMPYSRRNNEFCRMLDNMTKVKLNEGLTKEEYNIIIDGAYSEIIGYLSQIDYPGKKINKRHVHPKGHKCHWDHSTARYCWLNLISATFNMREIEMQKVNPDAFSLEFRCHSGSLNYIKIYQWVKICMGFVWFIENCKRDILRKKVNINGIDAALTLKNIMQKAYPKASSSLLRYIDMRTEMFTRDADKISINEDLEYLTEKNTTNKSIKELLCV